MLAEILLLILEIGWHYHNSGPEKVRTANSKFFFAYLSIFRGPISTKMYDNVRNLYGRMETISDMERCTELVRIPYSLSKRTVYYTYGN